MKKVIYNKFGGVDLLEMVDAELPAVTATSVLVKVKAVSINPIDWKIREGEMKLMSGSKFPKEVGIDFSGVVEQVGDSVKGFKPGDEVFGSVDQFKRGVLAEYVAVAETDIATKPKDISFETAAAIPVVGFAALQMFDKLFTTHKGTEILINGASGGVGMLATQIAQLKGAAVTTVVGEKGISLAKKWGSDFVLDYRKTDILTAGKQYDVVIDLSGKIPYRKAKAIMKPSATYVNTVPGPIQIIGSFFTNLFTKRKYRVLLSKASQKDLATLAGYVSNGMEVVIGKTYKMEAFKEAYTEMPKGGMLGKAVFTVGD